MSGGPVRTWISMHGDLGALPDAEAKTIALSKVEAWKRADEFPVPIF